MSAASDLERGGDCDAQPDLVTINAVPSSWPVVLSQKVRGVVILKKPLSYSLEQRDYPRDSKKRIFPLNVFHQSLLNKETVERDFLVWSSTTKALYFFLALSWARNQYSKGGNCPLFVGTEKLAISGGNS